MQKYLILNNPKENNIIRIYIIIFIISLFVTILINFLVGLLQECIINAFQAVEKYIHIIDWLNLIPSVSFFALFYLSKLLFDKVLWKLFVCYTGIPNINGEWSGKISSSYGIELDMKMIINQTLDKIQVTCDFGNSKSESCIVALDVGKLDHDYSWKIYFSYINQNVHNDEHIGFNIVEYKINRVTNKYFLEGEYFTNRPRENISDKGTFGTFTLM